VAPILAQVDGDAVGARRNCGLRRPQRIGVTAAARVPERRHVIDIHAKADRSDFSH
jgi:hypothetical protein